jgi:hypothetical protein
MILREFNPAGIAAFKAFLAECRENPRSAAPMTLLLDERMTEVVKPRTNVEAQHFTLRREAADYLRRLLAPLPEDEVAENPGLWSWLSLCYFDQVCPLRGGRRTVKNDYSYVFDAKNTRNFYRHLLFISWYAAHIASPHDRLFMSAPVSSLDKVTSEVMKRLYLTRIPCIFEVLDRLYWDEDRGRGRVGIVDPRTTKAGDLTHRFPIRMRQLEKTYDLFSLTADQLIELLGAEFQPGGRNPSLV